MMADFSEGPCQRTFRHRKDAQQPRNWAFAAMGRETHFAQGFGGGKPSTSSLRVPGGIAC
jgi:hypothetical protein